jgi:hypothetical protein
MANADVSLETVKSTCDKLECSPQSKTSDSAYGGKARIMRHSEVPTPGKKTSDLGMGHGIPGYRGKFAPKKGQD